MEFISARKMRKNEELFNKEKPGVTEVAPGLLFILRL